MEGGGGGGGGATQVYSYTERSAEYFNFDNA